MNKDDRELLLKDLCARLPYGVKVKVTATLENLHPGDEVTLLGCTPMGEYPMFYTYRGNLLLGEFKPYLRPMSSMTEEEIEEYRNLSDEVIGSYGPYHHEFIAHCVRLGIKPDNPHECVDDFLNMGAIDFLNAHHFDYRSLIKRNEKGLALEAPKDMYKED